MSAPPRQIPLLDLKALHAPVRAEILAALERVFDSQSFILGDDVRQLENEIAAYCTAPYAVGCASGTDALILALEACGVGPGDGVLTTPFSFFATASAIYRAGARPVFADIDPATFQLDPAAVRQAARHAPAPIKAIIPVHLFGGTADMAPLLALAAAEGWSVVEDAAQAIGAEDRGRRAGSLGRFGCLSFFPSKNLGGLGDGGMITAASEADARRLRSLRVHGSTRKYYHETVGYNSRLDSLQAAALRVKLGHLDAETAGRQRHAARYSAMLAGLPVTTPDPAPHQTRHVFNQYVIGAPRRDELKECLAAQGIGTEIYYPLPLHLQACFAPLGYRRGDFPESEKAAARVLALPVHSALAAGDLEYVAEAIARFYEGK